MQLTSTLLRVVSGVLLLSSSCILPQVTAAPIPAEGDIHTATRIYHTLINESPWLVDRTTLVTWTEGPTVRPTTTTTTTTVRPTYTKPPKPTRPPGKPWPKPYANEIA